MAPRDDEPGYDVRRREFFRSFGREAVRNAGAVMGAASELRRASGDAARELLDVGSAPMTGASTVPPAPSAVNPADDRPDGAAFRSAYRIVDDALVLLDQRDLPGRTATLIVREASEIASAIRLGVVNAGPVLGEICAYGLAFAARDATGRPAQSRDQLFRAAANTMRSARRDVHAIASATNRLVSRYDVLVVTSGVGADLAANLRAEADAVATDAALAHASLGRSAAAYLGARRAADGASVEPLNFLIHGDMGPLSCGLVGTATAILQSLVSLGHPVHVWLTEAAPAMEGSRISALQLKQADVPHTVIADTALGWLVSSRRLDGALLRGDSVTANGDSASLIGSLNVALVAASEGVPVYVVAPRSAFDAESADGASIKPDLQSTAEHPSGTLALPGSAPRASLLGARLSPATDIVPAAAVAGFFTEAGFTARLEP